MKVWCFTSRPSLDLVCYINGARSAFPDSWPGGAPRQDECTTVDEIKNFIKETNAAKVMFCFRANGIPNRAVSVEETAKIDKALKRLERLLK